jgi:(p)ppGpp synthase/HD superfamily hydrolase
MQLTQISALHPEIARALDCAKKYHFGQVRKYTNEPYISHPVHVACLYIRYAGFDVLAATVLLLHDVVEDCGASLAAIAMLFGIEVADGVAFLTESKMGNRATRKARQREKLSKAPAYIQTGKVCDLLSNIPLIKENDPSFYKAYRLEALALLDALTLADPDAVKDLRKILET